MDEDIPPSRVSVRIPAAKSTSAAKRKLRDEEEEKQSLRNQSAKGEKRTKQTAVARKKSIREVRKERKRQEKKLALQKQKEQQKYKNQKIGGEGGEGQEGRIVAADDSEVYWEMESVVARRVRGSRVEYLVRWKGCPESENTWEPVANLCDTALLDALRFARAEKKRQAQREANEKRLFNDDHEQNVDNMTELPADAGPKDGVPKDGVPMENVVELEGDGVGETEAEEFGHDDPEFDWTEQSQVVFQSVVRVNVNEEDAAKRVAQARMEGTPIVLIGHVGWANFAKRWLRRSKSAHPEEEKKNEPSTETDWLDLRDDSYSLDINLMMDDIGMEDVPVVRRKYNETNPIHGTVSASKFLSACWPSANNDGAQPPRSSHSSLYLHQWQFPLSDTAGRKLCHQNNPLPNCILGEDLLKYWLDLPQCKSDSPLQYIFMGREETMSKLHRDKGGLDISIAPIVGRKECVLVHRSDGANCLYHLNAKLDNIDLHEYPLLSRARIWRTIIEPGEILLMPYGTYHQCRNVTPCLSYSRFHLDALNLMPFFQSMIDGDAPELDHYDILWNCTSEIIRKVDGFVDLTAVALQRKTPLPPMGHDVVTWVQNLRTLRHFARELARRNALRNKVKGNSVNEQKAAGAPVNGSGTRMPAISLRKMTGDSSEDHDWDILVDDVDLCLHEFRYRRMSKIPTFRPRRVKVIRNPITQSVFKERVNGSRGTDHEKPVVAYDTALEKAYLDMKNSTLDLKKIALMDPSAVARLHVSDRVTVRLERKKIPGEIVQIEPQMQAAYLSYEDYPSLYDEYQPYEQLRVPVSGDSSSEISPEDVKVGLMVSHAWGERLKEEYRACVQKITCEKMFKIRLEIGRCIVERWFPADRILAHSVPVGVVSESSKSSDTPAESRPTEAPLDSKSTENPSESKATVAPLENKFAGVNSESKAADAASESKPTGASSHSKTANIPSESKPTVDM